MSWPASVKHNISRIDCRNKQSLFGKLDAQRHPAVPNMKRADEIFLGSGLARSDREEDGLRRTVTTHLPAARF